MPTIPIRIAIQPDDFSAADEIARIEADANGIGAVVTFTGICRSEDGRLAALELEHYPGMAEAEIQRIAQATTDRWPVRALTVIHRHGRIPAGGNIVLVVAASPHRHAAFEAASYLMDFLKTRAPFWKKEHFIDGTSGGWVEAKDADDAALERWAG